jgi:hypothetical protein
MEEFDCNISYIYCNKSSESNAIKANAMEG